MQLGGGKTSYYVKVSSLGLKKNVQEEKQKATEAWYKEETIK